MNVNKLLIALFALSSFAAVSCSNDEDEPQMPANAVTLNMPIGDSATTIGGSDVYINRSNNFTSSNCGIADLGRKGGFNRNPELSQIAQDMAVTPGNYYQIFSAGNVKTVAGKRAYPINCNYYNVRVDSWISDKNNDITGARISYVECYPQASRLPEWDSLVKTIDSYYVGNRYEYAFDNDVVVDPNYDVYNFENSNMQEHLSVAVDGNRISFSISGSAYGKAEVVVLVRHESLYTRARFIVQ